MSWSSDFLCPVCETDECVPAHGSDQSQTLIVGFEPESKDISRGMPFSDRVGTILRTELGQLGHDLSQFRRMNLWNHAPNKNPDCFLDGKERVLKEIMGEPEEIDGDIFYPNKKKLILLVGSAVVKEFTGLSVKETCGLFVESPHLSVNKIMAIYKPSIVFHSVVGEVRLALRKFVSEVDKYE